MERIESDLNSVTGKGTRFAAERLSSLIDKIVEIKNSNIGREKAWKIAKKIGIVKRLSKIK